VQPFFLAIKKNGADFYWNDQCKAAIQSLKAYLASLPLLSTPLPDETLLLYLAVSNTVVSAALMSGWGHPKAGLLCQQGLDQMLKQDTQELKS